MQRYATPASRAQQPIAWPGGARIAVWFVPNVEFYEMAPPDNPARRAWHRPAPDILAYSARDFGNRVGVWRVMDTLARHGVRASVSLNAALCDHLPEIVQACVDLDWELMSHGVYNTRLLFGMSEDQVRQVIGDSVRTISDFAGRPVEGFLAPAISFTDTFLDLLPEFGVKYTIDLVPDDQPIPLKVRRGELICLPYSTEINDIRVLGFRSYQPEAWADMVKAAFDQLYLEGESGGTVLCVPLHPFVIGQSHRIGALDGVIRHILGHEGVWMTTGREIAASYASQRATFDPRGKQ